MCSSRHALLDGNVVKSKLDSSYDECVLQDMLYLMVMLPNPNLIVRRMCSSRHALLDGNVVKS